MPNEIILAVSSKLCNSHRTEKKSQGDKYITPLSAKLNNPPVSPLSPVSQVQLQPNPSVRQLYPASPQPQSRIHLPLLPPFPSFPALGAQTALPKVEPGSATTHGQAEGARTTPAVTTAPAAGHVGRAGGRQYENKQKARGFAGFQIPNPASTGPP